MKHKNSNSIFALCITTLFFIIPLVGCGGGSNENSISDGLSEGQFMNSSVEGVQYLSGNKSGITDVEGTFLIDGPRVKFLIGDIVLGEGTAKSLMTPMDLVPGAANETDPAVTNITRLLMTLDDDGNPDNGIYISQEVRDAAIGKSINFTQTSLAFENDANVQMLVAELTALTTSGARNLVSASDAQEHLNDMLLGYMSFTLTITTSGDSIGTITSSPEGINCESNCSKIYAGGTNVTLNVTPANNTAFSHWGGDADCADGVVSMTANKTCTAIFDTPSSNMATLTVIKGGTSGGTVTSNFSQINCGTTCSKNFNIDSNVTLTATPSSSATFKGWSGDSDCSDGVVTMTTNKTCIAIFNLLNIPDTNILNITKEGSGAGVVTSASSEINCGAICSASFDNNTDLTLRARPSEGSKFVEWSGDYDCINGNIIMSSNRTCVAIFNLVEPPPYTLNILFKGTGSGKVTSSYLINCEKDCSKVFDSPTGLPLTITPSEDSIIADWSGDRGCKGGFLYLTSNLTCTVTFSTLTGTIALYPGSQFPTGNRPTSVAVADINNDNLLDLITANQLSDDVSIQILNHDGNFQAHQTFSVGNDPVSVVASDINGDGFLDLTTANKESDDISILLGIGDGTFHTEKRFSVGREPISVATADLNNDELLDMITANRYSDNVSVLLNNGDDTFQTHKDFPAGDGAKSVAVADFNGDGHLDLVTANYRSEGVSVLLGEGDGTFQTQQQYSAGGGPLVLDGPQSVEVADLNGDTFPDLITANMTSKDVSVLLNKGDGTFLEQRRFLVTEGINAPLSSDGPVAVTSADLNDDGYIDLITANWFSADVSVLLNNGDATFQKKRNFPVVKTLSPLSVSDNGPISVTIADMNGDEILDVITANGGSDDISILLGKNDGFFQIKQSLPFLAGSIAFTDYYSVRNLPFASDESVIVADLNGDKFFDIATADKNSDSVTLWLSNNDGVLQESQNFAVGKRPRSLTVTDLNGDGFLDLVTANEHSDDVSVLLNNINGSFQIQQRYLAADRPEAIAVADLDGDGHLDLVTTSWSPKSLSILMNNGEDTFQPPLVITTAGSRTINIADLNNDGILDLVTANEWLVGNGDGSFQFRQDIPSNDLIVDLNGDGILDLVTIGLAVSLNNGDGTFKPQQRFPKGSSSRSVAVADVNGDGNVDLVTSNSDPDKVSVLLGNGDGTFQLHQDFNADVGLLAPVDLDGDGLIDLLTVNDKQLNVVFQHKR